MVDTSLEATQKNAVWSSCAYCSTMSPLLSLHTLNYTNKGSLCVCDVPVVCLSGINLQTSVHNRLTVRSLWVKSVFNRASSFSDPQIVTSFPRSMSLMSAYIFSTHRCDATTVSSMTWCDVSVIMALIFCWRYAVITECVCDLPAWLRRETLKLLLSRCRLRPIKSFVERNCQLGLHTCVWPRLGAAGQKLRSLVL